MQLSYSIIATAMLVLAACAAAQESVVWTGAANTNYWDTPSNWSPRLPTSADHVTINSAAGTSSYVLIRQPTSVASLTVGSANEGVGVSASLTVQAALNVYGQMQFVSGNGQIVVSNSSTLMAEAYVQNVGTLYFESGTLSGSFLFGVHAQVTIAQASFANVTLTSDGVVSMPGYSTWSFLLGMVDVSLNALYVIVGPVTLENVGDSYATVSVGNLTYAPGQDSAAPLTLGVASFTAVNVTASAWRATIVVAAGTTSIQNLSTPGTVTVHSGAVFNGAMGADYGSVTCMRNSSCTVSFLANHGSFVAKGAEVTVSTAAGSSLDLLVASNSSVVRATGVTAAAMTITSGGCLERGTYIVGVVEVSGLAILRGCILNLQPQGSFLVNSGAILKLPKTTVSFSPTAVVTFSANSFTTDGLLIVESPGIMSIGAVEGGNAACFTGTTIQLGSQASIEAQLPWELTNSTVTANGGGAIQFNYQSQSSSFTNSILNVRDVSMNEMYWGLAEAFTTSGTNVTIEHLRCYGTYSNGTGTIHIGDNSMSFYAHAGPILISTTENAASFWCKPEN